MCVVAHVRRVGACSERAAEGVLGESDGTSPVGDADGDADDQSESGR